MRERGLRSVRRGLIGRCRETDAHSHRITTLCVQCLALSGFWTRVRPKKRTDSSSRYRPRTMHRNDSVRARLKDASVCIEGARRARRPVPLRTPFTGSSPALPRPAALQSNDIQSGNSRAPRHAPDRTAIVTAIAETNDNGRVSCAAAARARGPRGAAGVVYTRKKRFIWLRDFRCTI